jgi:hypothetical protein
VKKTSSKRKQIKKTKPKKSSVTPSAKTSKIKKIDNKALPNSNLPNLEEPDIQNEAGIKINKEKGGSTDPVFETIEYWDSLFNASIKRIKEAVAREKPKIYFADTNKFKEGEHTQKILNCQIPFEALEWIVWYYKVVNGFLKKTSSETEYPKKNIAEIKELGFSLLRQIKSNYSN